MITLASNVRWTSNSPKIDLSFYYEKQRSGANMQYRIKTRIRPLTETSSSGSFGYPIIETIKLDGSEVVSGHQLKGTSPSRWSSAIEYTTGWFTVSNKTSGTTSLSIKVYSSSGSSRSQTYSYSLEVDPAYFTQSPSLWLISTTETTATFGWSTPQTCDQAQYNINGGGWVDCYYGSATSGTFTISGLSANTSYTIYGDFKRQDSQLWSTWGGYNVYTGATTYNYPNYSSMNNFTIGQNPTINIYNPLGRTCEVSLLGDDDSLIGSATISGTSVSNLADATKLYQSIPNKASANCKVKVVYSNSTITKTASVYSVDASLCSPSFSTITYEDTNSDTLAITNDSSIVLSDQSEVSFSVSGLEVKNYATINKVELWQHNSGNFVNMNISGTTATTSGYKLIYNNEGNKDVVVRIIDSRGLMYSSFITTDLINYKSPTFTLSVERLNNFYTSTNFKTTTNYTQIGTNTITFQVRYQREDQQTWSNWESISANGTTTINLDNNYTWMIEAKTFDSLTSSTTITRQLQRGMPLAFYDITKNSMSINCFPQFENSFELNGSPINSIYTDTEPQPCGMWHGNIMYRVSLTGDLKNYLDNYLGAKIEIPVDTSKIANVIYHVSSVSNLTRMKFYSVPHYTGGTVSGIIEEGCYIENDKLYVNFKLGSVLYPVGNQDTWSFQVVVYYIESQG